MTNIETNLNKNIKSEATTYNQLEVKQRLSQNIINWIGIAALILGLICFIWAYVNISLFTVAISPTNEFGNATPIFSSKMFIEKDCIKFSLTINGIIFIIANLILLGLTITYFITNKDFYKNLVVRLVNKKCLITFLTFSAIILATYLVMIIIAFVPPNLSILTKPDSGKQIVGNINALFNWQTTSLTTRNAGFYVMIVLFTISLILYLVTSVLYFQFQWIYEKYQNISKKVEALKVAHQEKKKQKNNENKFSLRDLIVKAREARQKAKQEKDAQNSLRQNLTDVVVDTQNASIKPEEITVDQHGTANQEVFDTMPKITSEDLNNTSVDKSEPRRLGKLFADLKEKQKDKKKNKGTNINKKATVAAPTKEINDLVKQLMPD